MNENVKPGPGGWATIEIALHPRYSNFNATRRAQIVGPLGVHATRQGGPFRQITHLKSGYRFPWYFDAHKSAVRCAKALEQELGDEVDWNEPPGRLFADVDIERLREVANQFSYTMRDDD